MTSTWQMTMDAKLETFAGWHLSTSCARCWVLVQLDVDRLRPAHAGRTMAEVVERLRCCRCEECRRR